MHRLGKAIVLYGNQMSKSKMDDMLLQRFEGGQLEGCFSEASRD